MTEKNRQITREWRIIGGIPAVFCLLLMTLFFISKNFLWIFPIIPLLILVLFSIYFLRQPEALLPADPESILSPAQGKVLSVVPDTPSPMRQWGERFTRITVFMSPMDVHWSYAPIAGKLEDEQYLKGNFRAAFQSEAHHENEQWRLWIQNPETGVSVILILIAGWLARRIQRLASRNQLLAQGQILGLIRYGSAQVIYIPENFEILVKTGQKVKAGKTILARRRSL